MKISDVQNILGTYGSGSLLANDVADAWHAMAVAVGLSDNETVKELTGLSQKLYDTSEDADDYDAVVDELNHAIDEVDTLVNEALPPVYVYAGTHPGDPADFGIWADVEAVEDARQNGEIGEYADYVVHTDEGEVGLGLLHPSRVDDDVSAIVDVNDHGNMTLYVRSDDGSEWVVAWDCV